MRLLYAESWKLNFDMGHTILAHSADGQLADTVGVIASKIAGPALVPGFNDTLYGIDLVNPTMSSMGKTICIDSSFFRGASPGTSGTWKWVASGGFSYRPTWSGQRCFTVGDCCINGRGNLDGDSFDGVDIADLMKGVDVLFFYPDDLIACQGEADIDNSGGFDISDLQWLVDYLTFGGPPPPMCP